MAIMYVSRNGHNRKRKVECSNSSFSILGAKRLQSDVNEIMDKSAFYKFSPGEGKTKGIVDLLMEMLKIRRSINILNMHPEKADEYSKLK